MPEITDDQLKGLVKQAFVSLDKEYFDSIGEKLAARMVMRVEGDQDLANNKERMVLRYKDRNAIYGSPRNREKIQGKTPYIYYCSGENSIVLGLVI